MYKKILFLLSRQIKIKLLILTLLSFLVSFLEVISISSIPLFLSFIINPNYLLAKIKFITSQELFNLFYILTDFQRILFSSIFLILFFILKNILILIVQYYEAIYFRKLRHDINLRLFNSYLLKPYSFFLDNTKADMMRSVDYCHSFAGSISAYLLIIKELVLILGLLSAILFFDFKIIIMIVIILSIYLIIYYLKFSKILLNQGKYHAIYNKSNLNLLNEFYSSIIEIKILLKEKFFFKLFNKNIWKLETANIYPRIIAALTKPLFETISLFFILGILVYYTYLGNKFEDVLLIITFISLSLIRMLPSFTSLFNNLNSLRFHKPSVEILISIISENNCIDNKRINLNFDEEIELKNISFTHKNSKSANLTDINFKISKNDKIGLIGKTGSGKTTLVNIVSGILNFNSGSILVNKKILLNSNDSFYWNNFFYFRQDSFLLGESLKKNVAFGVDDSEINDNKVVNALKLVGLYDDVLKNSSLRNNEELFNTKLNLSGGQKQLVNLARLVYANPNFIILDEATSNLDYKSEQSFFNVIKNLNVTTLIVAHRVKTLEFCNKIILMENGKIIDEGSLIYFLKKYNNLNSYIN
jgi:ABC-type bacteriocin/lantibiotic exporter with double-glycine peptidase domain